jgi:hypothetical protein
MRARWVPVLTLAPLLDFAKVSIAGPRFRVVDAAAFAAADSGNRTPATTAAPRDGFPKTGGNVRRGRQGQESFGASYHVSAMFIDR